MNCTQSLQFVDDYLDGSLAVIQQDRLHRDLSECKDCRQYYEQANNLLTELKDIPVPPPRAGYEERMLAFLNSEQTEKHCKSHWFATGFATAFAASFALWIVFSSPGSLFKQQVETIEIVKLSIQQPRTVDLVFNLANDLSDATISLELPDKFQIAGYPGKQKLQWKTSFKKGTNRLTLPLIATEEQNGFLIARLSKKGKTKVFRIRLDSQAPMSSTFEENVTTNT